MRYSPIIVLLIFSLFGLAPLHAESRPLFEASRGGLWGYIDSTGSWAIEPAYLQAEPFSEGRAAVFNGELWGIINEEGKFVVEPEFRSRGRHTLAEKYTFADGPVSRFAGGYASVCSSRDGCFLIDRDGNRHLTDRKYRSILPSREGYFAFQEAGSITAQWGFITSVGEEKIAPRFVRARAFTNGMAAVSEDRSSWGYVDESGQYVLEPKFSDAGDFVDGIAPVRVDFSPYEFINAEGEKVIEKTFHRATSFSEGFSLVRDSFTSRPYFINRDGEQALEEITGREDLCMIQPFRNGLAQALLLKPGAAGCGELTSGHDRMFAENGQLAYINMNNEVVWTEE